MRSPEIGSIRKTMQDPGATVQQHAAGRLYPRPENHMSTTTHHWHRKQTALHLARRALHPPEAGTLTSVGLALPKPVRKATVGSYVTRTACPDLLPLFEVLTGARPWSTRAVLEGLRVFAALHRSPDTRGRPLAEMVMEATVYAENVDADERTLEARVRYLLAARHQWNADECRAAESGSPDFPDALDREGFGQIEAAQGLRILDEVHGVRVITPTRERSAQRRRA